MAVLPLYIDKDQLLSELRMKESQDTETLLVIDHTIAKVRVDFFRRLGRERALEIAALPYEENPTTVDEILKSQAVVTESYWVQFQLICALPTMYITTQFAIQNNFDDVPITRDADTLQNFKDLLWNAIEQGLGQLMLPIDDDAGAFQSFSTGRSTPYILGDNAVGRPFRTI